MSELDRARAGQYVAARRGRLGLSKGQLADLADLDRKTLYYLERGERWPYPKTCAAIERALGLADGDLQRIAAGQHPSPDLLAEHIAQRMAELGLDWEQLARATGLSETTMEWIRDTYAPDDAQALALDRALRWEPGSTRAILSSRRSPVPSPEQKRRGESHGLRQAAEDAPVPETSDLLEEARRLAHELEQAVYARTDRHERTVRAVKQYRLALEALEEELGDAG